jgi:hypothetical protein
LELGVTRDVVCDTNDLREWFHKVKRIHICLSGKLLAAMITAIAPIQRSSRLSKQQNMHQMLMTVFPNNVGEA